MVAKLKAILFNPPMIFGYLAMAMAFFLPLSKAVANLLLIPFFIAVILNYRSLRWTSFKPFYFLLALFLWLFVLDITLGNISHDFSFFINFSMVFILYFLMVQAKNKKHIEYAFLLGLLVSLVGSTLNTILYNFKYADFSLANGWGINESLWLDRPYLSFLMAVGIFICLNLAEKNKKKWRFYILASLFFIFNIYITARLAIGLGVFLIIFYLIRTHNLNRTQKIGIVTSFLVLIGIGLSFSPNFNKRMKINNEWENTWKKIKNTEGRFVIWPCAYQVAKNEMDLWTGLKSRSEIRERLSNCYGETITENKDKRRYFLSVQYYTDNQFLGFLLFGGLIALTLFLMFFMAVWFSKLPFETKMFFFLFFIFAIVSNVLTRQIGCFSLGIFSALYLKNYHHKLPSKEIKE